MKWYHWIVLIWAASCAANNPVYGGGHADYSDQGFYTLDNPADPITTEEPQYQHPAMDKTASGPYFVRIDPGADHFADVTFQNRLTYGPSTVTDVTFIFEGLPVRTVVDAGNGDEPDTLTVYPPAGFYAIPESSTLEEHERGVIEIHEQLLY